MRQVPLVCQRRVGARKEVLALGEGAEEDSLMNYCCMNSELYPRLLSTVYVMLQVLFFTLYCDIFFEKPLQKM